MRGEVTHDTIGLTAREIQGRPQFFFKYIFLPRNIPTLSSPFGVETPKKKLIVQTPSVGDSNPLDRGSAWGQKKYTKFDS